MVLERSKSRNRFAFHFERWHAVGDPLVRFRHDLHDRPPQRLQGASLRLAQRPQKAVDLLRCHDVSFSPRPAAPKSGFGRIPLHDMSRETKILVVSSRHAHNVGSKATLSAHDAAAKTIVMRGRQLTS
jgi:hypothetical protein